MRPNGLQRAWHVFSCPFGSIDPRCKSTSTSTVHRYSSFWVPVCRALRTFSHVNCQNPAVAVLMPYLFSVFSLLSSAPMTNLSISPASIRGGQRVHSVHRAPAWPTESVLVLLLIDIIHNFQSTSSSRTSPPPSKYRTVGYALPLC